jgi:hypothetical protein
LMVGFSGRFPFGSRGITTLDGKKKQRRIATRILGP